MASHRTPRLAEAIREVVSAAILFEVADPRVRAITVLRAEMSGDHRNATVFVSIMGSEAEQRTAMKGLKSASGFLQSRVANRLQTRYTPILAFKFDESVKKSACKAQLKIDVSQATIERMVLNIAGLEALASAGIQRAGDSLTADIDYAAQPTDDGKQVYVQVQAIGPVSRAVGLLAFAATMPQEAVSGGSGAVSSQVPRPTPPPPPAPAPIPVEPVQAQAPTAIQAQRLPTVPPTAAPASPALPVAPAPDDPLCTGLKTAVTSELLECIERRFVAADRDLNLEYKRAMGVLPPDRQATLRAPVSTIRQLVLPHSETTPASTIRQLVLPHSETTPLAATIPPVAPFHFRLTRAAPTIRQAAGVRSQTM